MTAQQVQDHRASHHSDENDSPDVDVVATVFDTGRDTAYPVLLLSHRADVILDEPGHDRVDLLVSFLVSAGWNPITTLAEPPAPGPLGYQVRFSHETGEAGAPGIVELLDPSGQPETVANVIPTRYWRPAVVRTGQVVVLQGSKFLGDWPRRGERRCPRRAAGRRGAPGAAARAGQRRTRVGVPVSLTSQLDGRELAQWCAQAFPGTPAAVEQVIAAARRAGRPVRPAGQVPVEHWAEVGGAFGQRLADLVDPAPPYAALLGLLRAGWMCWDDAHAQAAAYPSHRDLDVEHAARALSLRRTPDGWLDLGPTRDHLETDPAAAAAFGELLERTRTYQAKHAPAGQLGAPGAEAGLARSAWVIAACEGIHRSGFIDQRLVNALTCGGRAAELRAIPAEPVVAELVELAGRLHTQGVLDELRRRAGHPGPGEPLGVAAPTFVPSWADGDLLVGTPEATTLLDVKTVISLSKPDRIARWCWQILLYAWLDTTDMHHIRAVGLYLARHGSDQPTKQCTTGPTPGKPVPVAFW